MYACIHTYLHTCVCEREKDRESERETDRERERGREGEGERERERQNDLEGLREIVRIQFAKLPCIPAHTLTSAHAYTHTERE